MVLDEIGNPVSLSDGSTYTFSQTGIAWPADKSKFVDSPLASSPTVGSLLIPPPAWQTNFPQWSNGYNTTNFPNISRWERLHVWMRTAGLPNFRKLWGKNTDQDLPAGSYTIQIVDSKYSVLPFLFIISLFHVSIMVKFGMNIMTYHCFFLPFPEKISFPCYSIWCNKIDCNIYSICTRRKKSIPWHCLYYSWNRLFCVRNTILNPTYG